MHEDEPGLTSLVAKGILCRLNQIIVANNENSGWYTLTDYSRKLMLYAFQLRSPRPLLEFQREGVQIEQSTAVELVQLLAQQGWIDKSTKRPRSVVPCSTGSEKIWWRKPLQAVSIAYLQTLAKVRGDSQTTAATAPLSAKGLLHSSFAWLRSSFAKPTLGILSASHEREKDKTPA